KRDYENIGYDFQFFSIKQSNVQDRLLNYFPDQITVIAGQSGVGKSSILNTLLPSLDLKTADIFKSLGRGKHHTRHVEILIINNELVTDRQRNNSLYFNNIEQEELTDCFH